MFCALQAKISGERLQDHWSSGIHVQYSLGFFHHPAHHLGIAGGSDKVSAGVAGW